MNREFLEYYNRELALLYERAADFAAEFPEVANNLGGLTEEMMDPGLKGLLEGSAFLAARVQLELKSEFSEFTTNLLDQLLPNYLAPTASAVLVQATPNYGDPNLVNGLTFAAGQTIDATYVTRETRIACHYRLGSNLAIWPLSLEKAEYLGGPGPFQALGVEVLAGTVEGLKLSLVLRTGADEGTTRAAAKTPLISSLPIDDLPIHLLGNTLDRDALYEQIFAHCRRITVRYEDADGTRHFQVLRSDQLLQIGFEDVDNLQPPDVRSFHGFDVLRDFFTFPAKFSGFTLTGLRKVLARIAASRCDILFEFDSRMSRLVPVVSSANFALYAAPAANLFEWDCVPIQVDPAEHEHNLVTHHTHWLNYEVHRIVEVTAYYSGRKEKKRVHPLYSEIPGSKNPETALYYTSRRLQRQMTARERQFGSQTPYVGTETFVSLFEPADIDETDRARSLSVRAVVSNRHLPEQLPVGRLPVDFRLTDDTSIDLKCISGPTPPRDSIIHVDRRQRDAKHPGPVMWRLINFLTLSHLGLVEREEGDRAAGLRELLALFSNMGDTLTERQLSGIVSISTRPIVRRLRLPTGAGAARGIEITVVLDDTFFTNGFMLFGAVLERFFAEYSTINSFTETVITSLQRGEIMRWPARSGNGRLL